MAARIAKARGEISRWPDGAARHQALVMVQVLEDYPIMKQFEVFTRRDNIPISPEVRDRVFELLEGALPALSSGAADASDGASR